MGEAQGRAREDGRKGNLFHFSLELGLSLPSLLEGGNENPPVLHLQPSCAHTTLLPTGS